MATDKKAQTEVDNACQAERRNARPVAVGDLVRHSRGYVGRVLSLGSHEAWVSLEPRQVNEPGEQFWKLSVLTCVPVADRPSVALAEKPCVGCSPSFTCPPCKARANTAACGLCTELAKSASKASEEIARLKTIIRSAGLGVDDGKPLAALSSSASDRDRVGRFYEEEWDTCQPMRTLAALRKLVADVRRETIEACAVAARGPVRDPLSLGAELKEEAAARVRALAADGSGSSKAGE